MKFYKPLTAVALLPLLAACASNWDADGAMNMPSQGTAFQTALQKEYAMLAQLENEEGDWSDGSLFVEKAVMSAQGEAFDPQMIDERRLPSNKVSEMNNSRATLLQAFSQGGREKAPEAAAKAQASFDCWMQEQEENFQPEDIAKCKEHFEAGLRDMYAALADKPMEKPMVKAEPEPMEKMAPAPFIINFEFDSAEIDRINGAILDKAVKAIVEFGPEGVAIVGHTDTAGSDDYNILLAKRRADAVANYLADMNIPRSIMLVDTMGEEMTAVNTGDDVREAVNRRVVLELK